MDVPESDPQLNQIHPEINHAAQQVSFFLSTVTTACNLDFILSFLESGVLWSIQVEWARFYYFLPVESLSRVCSSCVWRGEESEVRSRVYYSPVLSKGADSSESLYLVQ